MIPLNLHRTAGLSDQLILYMSLRLLKSEDIPLSVELKKKKLTSGVETQGVLV